MIEITKEMLENLVEEGFYNKDGVLKNQDYTIDEMYLVRTTDIFPNDKKVKSVAYDPLIVMESNKHIYSKNSKTRKRWAILRSPTSIRGDSK